MLRRRRALLALSGAALATPMHRAAAQPAWPARAVTVIVPFSAGGSADVVARALSKHLTGEFGQAFVVDNRAGAAGNIGAQSLVNAAPDGYTLMMTTSGPGATNKLLYKQIPYDPEKDLAPIGLIADTPLVIAATPKQPFSTLPELIAYAKANPDALNFGTPGNGTMGHMAAVQLMFQQGVRLNHVPYRGTGPLTNDLLAGTLDLAFDFVPTYLAHFDSGALRGIAVTSPERLASAPQLRTTTEQGLPGYTPKAWFGLVGPARMPRPVIDRLNASINAYIRGQEGSTLLASLGAPVRGGTPEDFARTIREEVARWRPIVDEANIRLD